MFKIAAVSRRDTRTGSSACRLFGPAARWCVTFVFEGATFERVRVGRAAAGGRCREIRLSGPLFMLYTPLKHRARCHGFKFSRCTLECRNAVRGASTPRRCASCDATTLLRSVRGIRDVFMSKREREGDLEPSSMPSPALPPESLLLAFYRSAPNRMFPLRVPFPTSILPCLRVYSFTLYASSLLFVPGQNLKSNYSRFMESY